VAEPLVLVRHSGNVRTLTLNRPQALNSFTGAMHGELREALDAAAADRNVRCLVITGSGRGFCAGQDLADPAVAPKSEGAPTDVGNAIERFYKPLALRIRSMPVPVVAAVNGVAAGAGANFALLCDIVVATRSASFLQALGVGGAERIGLIWKCVDDDVFIFEVDALAARLATLPTKALVATRQALDAAQQLDLAAALSLEADVQRTLGAAPDFAEGVAAFMAKRAPTFTDR